MFYLPEEIETVALEGARHTFRALASVLVRIGFSSGKKVITVRQLVSNGMMKPQRLNVTRGRCATQCTICQQRPMVRISGAACGQGDSSRRNCERTFTHRTVPWACLPSCMTACSHASAVVVGTTDSGRLRPGGFWRRLRRSRTSQRGGERNDRFEAARVGKRKYHLWGDHAHDGRCSNAYVPDCGGSSSSRFSANRPRSKRTSSARCAIGWMRFGHPVSMN